MESDADLPTAALLAGWSGTGVLALLGFSHGDWAAILAAAVSALGVVIASRNSSRLRKIERQARRRRVVAIRRPEEGFEGPGGTLYDEDEEEDDGQDNE